MARAIIARSGQLSPSGHEATFTAVSNWFRSLVGAVLTASLVMSAVTWGSMPGCTSAQAPDAPAGHQHGMPAHPGGPAHQAATVQCFVHLCCLQMVSLPSGTRALERLDGSGHPSVAAPIPSFIAIRRSHALPFAHAPPRSLV
jgi:hypothetical protein